MAGHKGQEKTGEQQHYISCLYCSLWLNKMRIVNHLVPFLKHIWYTTRHGEERELQRHGRVLAEDMERAGPVCRLHLQIDALAVQ